MEATETISDVHDPIARAQWFRELYESTFPKVARYVANRGGSFEDARDIFHDALVILYEKTNAADRPIEVPEAYYLVGIAKHLWIRKFKDDHRKVGLEESEKMIAVPEDYYDSSSNRLVSLLELTGQKCLALLRAFYYDNLSLSQIKSAFGFSSAHSVSVQKFKCIEKMRNTIQEKSMDYEDFR